MSTWFDPSQMKVNFNTPETRLTSVAGDLQGMNLYDPEMLKQLQQMFAPLFQQQYGNLSAAQGAAQAQAGRGAGARAAAGGYANPGLYQQGQAERIAEMYAPMYGGLQSEQMKALLGATAGSGQFKAQNYGQAADIYGGQANRGLQWSMFQEQMANQPSFLENLFSGLIGGAAKVGSGFLLADWLYPERDKKKEG